MKWFYGNDPARDSDYHTIWIQGLAETKSGQYWNPLPRDVYRYKGKDYLDVLNFLFKTLFKKFPPTKFVTDATRDPTWAELITKKLGEKKTDSYKFTIDNKLHLMSIGRQYLNQNYSWPDVDQLEREKRIPADKAQMIRETKQEALREQMRPVSGDKISFSDGGKHNDLLHGWVLSLKGVYDYQKKRGFGDNTRKKILGVGGGNPGIESQRTDYDVALDRISKRFQSVGISTENMDIQMSD